jgi:hypothetical protein
MIDEENKVVEEKTETVEEQIQEKTAEEIYTEMFNFAKECEYDGNLVFNWVVVNVEQVEEKMRIWGVYVSEITKYNTTIQVKNEDRAKLLKILE